MILALLKKNELSVLLDFGLQTKIIKTTELLLHTVCILYEVKFTSYKVSHDTFRYTWYIWVYIHI